MENTKEEFKKLSGIDLTDHEHLGVFPYYKDGSKWSSISRGKAWQMYAQWLEDQSTSQKETIDRFREFVNWAINQDDYGSISGRTQFIKKANRLLSTTETINKETGI